MGGADLGAVAGEIGVPSATLTWWAKRARLVLEDAFGTPPALAESDEARMLLGEAQLEIELLRGRFYSKNPYSLDEVRAVSRIVSHSSGKPYGIERVCRVWRIPRSSYYQRTTAQAGAGGRKRGRPPSLADELLDQLVLGFLRDGTGSRLPSAAQVRQRLVEAEGLPVALRRVTRTLKRVAHMAIPRSVI